MKKVKKYLGSIVKVNERNVITYLGITRKYENFKKDCENERTKIELIKENVILYKVDVKDANGSLERLCKIREDWANKKYNYREYLTKNQIKLLLKEGLFIAVQGLGEITIKDIEKLEDGKEKIEWKFLDEMNFNNTIEFIETHEYEVGYNGIYVE